MRLTIGLSYAPPDDPKFDFYRAALARATEALGYELELVDLSNPPRREATFDGIVFTGGADIDPARYGKQSEAGQCEKIDDARDQSEFQIAKQAEEREIPVLGICRGLQLLNVYRGGTLITNIEPPTAMSHRRQDGYDSRHRLRIEPGSYLRNIVGDSDVEVNSAHHQGVERVGEGLTVSARAAKDGTIEALEWADPTGKPFFLAVQWHPERMEPGERCASTIFETFLWEVAAHKHLANRVEVLRATEKPR